MEVEIGRGKKARRAYGFDDIAIVPSRRTRDPDDVDISWNARSLPLRAAAARLGDGRRRLARAPRRSSASSAASRVLNLEGIWSRYEDADEQLERIAGLPPKDHRDARDAGDLPRAGQAGADRPADRGDQGQRRRRRRVAHAAEGRASTTRSRSRPGLDILVIQGTVDLGRARLDRRSSRSTSRSSSPSVPVPVRRRRLRLLLDRACT